MALPKFPLTFKGLNIVLVAASLLMLGGVGAYLSTNQSVNLKTGASNITQSTTGKLVKKGTAQFSPCKNATTPYALIGSGLTSELAKAQTPDPQNVRERTNNQGKDQNIRVKNQIKPTMAPTPACLPLNIQASLADPLIGDRVVVAGTFQNGIFFATSITKAGPESSSKPNMSPNPNKPDNPGNSQGKNPNNK